MPLSRAQENRVNELAEQYSTLRAEAERIKEEMDVKRGMLLETIEEFGEVPARAEKSKRIETPLYEIRASYSTTTELDANAIAKLKDKCAQQNGTEALEYFSRLFEPSVRWTMKPGATDLVARGVPKSAPRGFQNLWNACYRVKERAPTLNVVAKQQVEDVS